VNHHPDSGNQQKQIPDQGQEIFKKMGADVQTLVQLGPQA
jgi:hypothetical protein